MPLPTSVVFHTVWNGGATTAGPICDAASKKVTLATPTLSDADALTVTLPETVPPGGAVMLTLGATVSAVTVTRMRPIAVSPAALPTS